MHWVRVNCIRRLLFHFEFRSILDNGEQIILNKSYPTNVGMQGLKTVMITINLVAPFGSNKQTVFEIIIGHRFR